jgi:hypothetical protein
MITILVAILLILFMRTDEGFPRRTKMSRSGRRLMINVFTGKGGNTTGFKYIVRTLRINRINDLAARLFCLMA